MRTRKPADHTRESCLFLLNGKLTAGVVVIRDSISFPGKAMVLHAPRWVTGVSQGWLELGISWFTASGFIPQHDILVTESDCFWPDHYNPTHAE